MISKGEYSGIYLATVAENSDPEGRARLRMKVPDALGLDFVTTWAPPSVPLAGPKSGMYCVPPVGAGVWVQFQNGNRDYPVWVGGYWGKQDEVPPPAQNGPKDKPSVVIQSCGGHQLVISDASGSNGGFLLKLSGGALVQISDSGITLDTGKGAKLTLGDSGISIDNGKGAKIELQGNSVNVNSGALTIM